MGSSATAPAPALTHSTTLAMSALEGSGLPARVLEGLREFDWNGDGQIDADELHEASKAYSALRQAANTGKGEIPLRACPLSLQPLLRSLDVDQNGTINPAELAHAMQLYTQSKDRVRTLTRLMLWAFGLMVVMLAAITGVTFAVVELSKESSVNSDGAMVVKGNPATAVQTAAFLTPSSLSSEMSDEDLVELKYLTLQSPVGARMNLAVTGTVRLPVDESCHGSVVRVLTAVGTVTLDGKDIVFGADIDDALFREAGFVLSTEGAGKRLLGVYELLGLFNLLSGLEVTNPPCRGDKPGLPAGDFQMVLKVHQECALDAGNVCRHPISKRPYPHTKIIHGREYFGYEQRVMKLGDRMLTASHYDYAPDYARYELLDNTQPARRLTAEELGPGLSQRRLRSLSETDLTGKDVATWVARITPSGMLADTVYDSTKTRAYKCLASTVPPQIFSKMDRGDVVFEFVSYETETLSDGNERTLRRYRLTVENQREVSEGDVETVETTVDYLDDAATGYPVLMRADMPHGGELRIDVSFTANVSTVHSIDPPTNYFITSDPGEATCSDLDGKGREIPSLATQISWGKDETKKESATYDDPIRDANNIDISSIDFVGNLTDEQIRSLVDDMQALSDAVVADFAEGADEDDLRRLQAFAIDDGAFADAVAADSHHHNRQRRQRELSADTSASSSRSRASPPPCAVGGACSGTYLGYVGNTFHAKNLAWGPYCGVPAFQDYLTFWGENREAHRAYVYGSTPVAPTNKGSCNIKTELCPAACVKIEMGGGRSFELKAILAGHIYPRFEATFEGPFPHLLAFLKLKVGGVIDLCTKTYGLEASLFLDAFGIVKQYLGPASGAVAKMLDAISIDITLLEAKLGYDAGEGVMYASIAVYSPNLWLIRAVWTSMVRWNNEKFYLKPLNLGIQAGIDLGIFSFYQTIYETDFWEDDLYLAGEANEKVFSNDGGGPWPSNVDNVLSDSAWDAQGWGDFGNWAHCVSETHGTPMPAIGFRTRWESPGGDDTALNGVALICADCDLADPGAGPWGGYYEYRCPDGEYIVGYKTQVEGDQGGGDDTGMNAFKAKCSGGSWIGVNGVWGSWGPVLECGPHSFVGSITLKIEPDCGGCDDTALNAVKLACFFNSYPTCREDKTKCDSTDTWSNSPAVTKLEFDSKGLEISKTKHVYTKTSFWTCFHYAFYGLCYDAQMAPGTADDGQGQNCAVCGGGVCDRTEFDYDCFTERYGITFSDNWFVTAKFQAKWYASMHDLDASCCTA